jgi:hypothetical protein
MAYFRATQRPHAGRRSHPNRTIRLLFSYTQYPTLPLIRLAATHIDVATTLLESVASYVDAAGPAGVKPFHLMMGRGT